MPRVYKKSELLKEGYEKGLKDAKRLVEQVMSEYDPSTDDLFDAAKRGDEAAVRAAVEDGASVRAVDESGATALMVACKTSGDPDVVEALLEEGCTPAAVDIYGFNALMLAADNGFVDVVSTLLDRTDVNIDSVNNAGWTALMLAARGGHFSVVKTLLEEGANRSYTNEKGENALSAASGDVDIVALLQGKGEKKTPSDHRGKDKTTLTCELLDLLDAPDTRAGDPADEVESLLKAGANPNGADVKTGVTPLMMAASNGWFESVQKLLERGALVNLRDLVSGDNALIYAAKNEQDAFDVVRLLVSRGADPNHVDDDGLRAVDWATRKGNKRVVAVLRNV